jgi:hypothetical protein
LQSKSEENNKRRACFGRFENNHLFVQIPVANTFSISALDKLGFGDYRVPAETVLKECKSVAAKRRRQSTRLENLGIPEEELLRQQQALFAKVNLFISKLP